MTDDTMACPCGERGTWMLAQHDQRDFPLPAGHTLGVEIPIFIDHADGTRHRVQDGQVLG